jgi:hypothetical protein
MMEPLNYATVNPFIDVFDGALATQSQNKPKKLYAASYLFLTQYELIYPIIHYF